MPKGVKLVVPVIVAFCYPEEGFDTEESCIGFINDALAGYRPADLTVKVDGVAQETRDICEIAVAPADKVQGVSRHCEIRRRANRTLFNFVIGESDFYPSAPGVWRANSARGVWSVIDTSGLAVGEHIIKIRAVGQAGALIPFLAVTYKLTVARPAN